MRSLFPVSNLSIIIRLARRDRSSEATLGKLLPEEADKGESLYLFVEGVWDFKTNIGGPQSDKKFPNCFQYLQLGVLSDRSYGLLRWQAPCFSNSRNLARLTQKRLPIWEA